MKIVTKIEVLGIMICLSLHVSFTHLWIVQFKIVINDRYIILLDSIHYAKSLFTRVL